LRARGELASDGYPLQFAPSLGGRSSLRGYSSHRFAGDAAVNGGAELRVPVGMVNVLVRSRLGVFALADAGRVWFDGDSRGSWHTGIGGGFWLNALGHAVSVAYAQGEGHKLYLKYGMSY
jgi:hemolysin activation/secretion protein